MMWKRRRERKVKWKENEKEHWMREGRESLKGKIVKGKIIREKRIRGTLNE